MEKYPNNYQTSEKKDEGHDSQQLSGNYNSNYTSVNEDQNLS